MKVKVLVAQLCLTLCHPMDYSPPDSSVHGLSRQEYWWGGLLVYTVIYGCSGKQ